jgi:hypothetical protein
LERVKVHLVLPWRRVVLWEDCQQCLTHTSVIGDLQCQKKERKKEKEKKEKRKKERNLQRNMKETSRRRNESKFMNEKPPLEKEMKRKQKRNAKQSQAYGVGSSQRESSAAWSLRRLTDNRGDATTGKRIARALTYTLSTWRQKRKKEKVSRS